MTKNAGRAFSISMPVNWQQVIEKRLHYRFWDRERQLSNYATRLRETEPLRVLCPLAHRRLAWSGPPHDQVRAYVCLDCHAAACEPEIRDRGFDFETVPDWEIDAILELDLERQQKQNFRLFTGSRREGEDGEPHRL